MGSATRRQFQCNATGSEYFRVYFRNLFFTVISLGVYSAWAKVEKNRFFLGATSVAGDTFRYHASPIAILKGRAVLAIFALLTSILQNSGLQGALAASFLVVIIYPWAAAQSMRFRCANVSFRGIRFHSRVEISDAYAFLLFPILFFILGVAWLGTLTEMSLGAGAAIWVRFTFFFIALGILQSRTKQLFWSHASLGTLPFVCKLKLSDVLIGWVAGITGFGALATIWFAGMETVPLSTALTLLFFAGVFAKSYMESEWRTHFTNAISLDGVTFSTSLTTGQLYHLYVTLLPLTAITLGLYWPFAAVKIWKMKVESLSATVIGPVPVFERQLQNAHSAVGEAFDDYLSWDIGF